MITKTKETKMDWMQFVVFIASTVGLFFWNRSESNSDRREAAADRRDILQLVRNIQDEIKDFHGRLCALEEKNRK
jgi:uncharacterized protein (DUF2164 family)